MNALVSLSLRDRLVAAALEWESAYGVVPRIGSAVSEYDAATRLVGMSEAEYSAAMQGVTAVQKQVDFTFDGLRFQIKHNRDNPLCPCTKVPKAPRPYEWDALIWILYTPEFEIAEAWLWDVESYREALDAVPHVRPQHMRMGERLKPLPAIRGR
jgi:hypothetical protein